MQMLRIPWAVPLITALLITALLITAFGLWSVV